jgi:hypothetical protein
MSEKMNPAAMLRSVMKLPECRNAHWGIPEWDSMTPLARCGALAKVVDLESSILRSVEMTAPEREAMLEVAQLAEHLELLGTFDNNAAWLALQKQELDDADAKEAETLIAAGMKKRKEVARSRLDNTTNIVMLSSSSQNEFRDQVSNKLQGSDKLRGITGIVVSRLTKGHDMLQKLRTSDEARGLIDEADAGVALRRGFQALKEANQIYSRQMLVHEQNEQQEKLQKLEELLQQQKEQMEQQKEQMELQQKEQMEQLKEQMELQQKEQMEQLLETSALAQTKPAGNCMAVSCMLMVLVMLAIFLVL